MVKDYSKGKIYKIVNDENDKFYIGSTVSELSKRMGKHREKHNLCMSKNVGDLKKCKIILIEKYSCSDNSELLKRERYYFDKYKKEGLNIVNKQRPIRYEGEAKELHKEYREQNKEQIAKKEKEYREENKEQLAKKKKQYRQLNKEHIKEYYQTNKEQLAKKKKEYYQTNKEKRQQPYTCECGSKIMIQCKSQHLKSKKHILYLTNQ